MRPSKWQYITVKLIEMQFKQTEPHLKTFADNYVKILSGEISVLRQAGQFYAEISCLPHSLDPDREERRRSLSFPEAV